MKNYSIVNYGGNGLAFEQDPDKRPILQDMESYDENEEDYGDNDWNVIRIGGDLIHSSFMIHKDDIDDVIALLLAAKDKNYKVD